MSVDRVVARLVELREQVGLTQVEVAARMGTSQSVVARLEGGGRDPRLSTLRCYAEAVGAELVVRGSRRPDQLTQRGVAQLALRIRGRRDAHASVTATFREVVQFLDDANAVEPWELRQLIHDEPPSTDDGRWDALIAAAVEWVAANRNVASPPWTRAAQRKVAAPGWVVTPFRRLHPIVRENTPREFARHGVYVDRDSLVST